MQLLLKTSGFYSSRNSLWFLYFRQGITMGKRKTKAIQKDLGTFRDNQAYPGTIQAYWGIFRTLCYSGIIRTVAYLEPWHIPNLKHIQNPGIFTALVYSERWEIQNPRYIQEPAKHLLWAYWKNCNFFHQEFSKILPRSLLHQISWIFFSARKKESITKSVRGWKKESITSTEDQKSISKSIIK